MDYLYTVLKFIIGGSIIVGVTLLAEYVDPRYGGILAAAPMITTLAFIITYSEAGRQTTQQLVISTFWFMIPMLLPVPAGILFPDRAVQSTHEPWWCIRDLDWRSNRHEPDHYRLVINIIWAKCKIR